MLLKTRSKSITGIHIVMAVIFLLFAGEMALATIPMGKKEIKKTKQEKVTKVIAQPKVNNIPLFSGYIHFQEVIKNNDLLKQRTQKAIDNLNPKYDSLKAILLDSQKIIQESNSKLRAAATEEEKQDFVHTLSGENINGKIAFAEKITNLPQTITELEGIILENKKNINDLRSVPKVSSLVKSYDEELTKIQKNLTILKTFQQKGDYKKITAQTEIINRQMVTLLMMQKSWVGYKDIQQMIKNLEKSQKDLIRDVQLKLPIQSHIGDFHPPLNVHDSNVKVAVCMNTFDAEEPLLTREQIQSEFDVINGFYEENSFGQTHIELVDVVTVSEALPELDVHRNVTEEALFDLAACDPFIDFRQVDAFLVYPSKSVTGGQGRWENNIPTEEGLKNLGMISLRSMDFNIAPPFASFITHELGHSNFNMGHASSLECGDSTIRDNVEDCEIVYYGNRYDIMGVWGSMGHFSGWFKHQNGWITTNEIRSDGDYPLSIIELDSPQTQLIRIPFQDTPLCIEYRKPIGTDEGLSEAQFQLRGPLYQDVGIPEEGGLLINICQEPTSEERSILLLDPTPHDTTAELPGRAELDKLRSFIEQGENFENAELGLSLSWESQDDGSALVHINLDENLLNNE